MLSQTKSGGDGQAPAASAAPAIALPKGGGALRGIAEKFAAQPFTGTGSMAVPLGASPGRSGFGPRLTLSYDSGTGNGPFGLGWTLPIPSIARKTEKGLPLYRDAEESDVFILSGVEDLAPALVAVEGQWQPDTSERTLDGVRYHIRRYRPRVEGLFARIERWTSEPGGDTHWRSISRDNVTSVYGRTPHSRIADPVDPTRIFSWLICEIYDDAGNAAVYEYKAEDSAGVDLSQVHERNRSGSTRSSNRYLKRIRYGNRVSRFVQPDLAQADWMFEVVLDYGEHDAGEPRPDESGEWLCRRDPFSSYRSGFEVRSYRLCQRVLMFHHFPDDPDVGRDCLVRSTELAYRSSDDEADDRRRGQPIASFIAAIAQSGYARQEGGGFIRSSMPPLEFEYSPAEIHHEVHEVDAESLANLPSGADGIRYHWLDLDGEGLPGLLTEQADAWFYKANLSPAGVAPQGGGGRPARLGASERLAVQPNLSLTGRPQFVDLAGDGQPDLVTLDHPTAGFYERTSVRGWTDFRAFRSCPTFDPGDPNLRFVDLDGDGHADALVAEHAVFTWYPSLGEEGFGPARHVVKALDEEKGPAVVFADGTQSIFLADMCGDGLTDVVRIRNGEVCYWPNLGYGRFGAKVTMDHAPWFDHGDQFDQRRVRLADVDGSGASDIIYLGRNSVRLYFNQSGNSWSAAQVLTHFPAVDNLTNVAAVDLLGNGTACLVWSSPLSGDVGRPMRYVDLMGGQKPHLLVSVSNNLGAETRVEYASSTRFYLADRMAGRPWITRLPFPVQVIERIETVDRISGNRFVSRYSYHHGFFDAVEREFRGFGLVEQQDTEEFDALAAPGDSPDATNMDRESHVPPVLTRTWMHTGAYLPRGSISLQFEHEYYQEPLPDSGSGAWLLPDTILEAGLAPDEERQACRVLKGAILRQEVYARDGTSSAERPYVVSERNYTVRLLQPQEGNRDAVFLVHPRETLDFHYERAVADVGGEPRADPRVSHTIDLAVDDFGNRLQSAAIVYGRRSDPEDPLLTDADRDRQRRSPITYAEGRYTNPVVAEGDLQDDAYRAPMACETRTYDLLGVRMAPEEASTRPFRFDEIRLALQAAGDGAHDLPYEDVDGIGAADNVPHRRLIEHARIAYRRNDLAGPLPVGQLESMALPFQTYRLALTPGLLEHVYGDRVDPEVLETDGRYARLDDDTGWWTPSERVFFSAGSGDAPAEELAFARERFFLARRVQDPFGSTTDVEYDDDHLLVTRVTDPLGNQVRSENDYRVLQPRQVTDPNGNRAAAEFDALGMVVGVALTGKAGAAAEGDSLAGFAAHLDDATVQAHLRDPLSEPHAILHRATTRLVYDLFAYQRTRHDPQPQPAVTYTLTRETHDAALAAGERTRVQHAFSYSDGFGREIQRKVEAEPETAAVPQWVGSGWTIFNNKGKPVLQYEPFFSPTHEFEFARTAGVSSTLFYDPLGRVVATLHPDHSWEKARFDPWRHELWDVSDTCQQANPADDADVGDFFERVDPGRYLPSWLDQRLDGAMGPLNQAAAIKSSAYANTPTIVHADSLGRPFLTVAHNRFRPPGSPPDADPSDELYVTRVDLDIEGNPRRVVDARLRIVMRYDYDILGRRIHQSSMESGENWTLPDVAGNPILAWNSRGHELRTTYDALRRPADHFLREGNGPPRLVARRVYGESRPDPESSNLRGRVVQLFDCAGVVTTDLYDFKGNALRSIHEPAADYRAAVDWSEPVALEGTSYSTATTYDALNRPVSVTSPDNSVALRSYSEAGLLESLGVNLRGAAGPTMLVNRVAYNARGQRERIDYGNGVRTTCTYDEQTFAPVRLETRRGSDQLQDLRYTYDIAGSIVHVEDHSQQTIFFSNAVVEADADYTYDAVARLIAATGREHIGQAGSPQTTWDDAPRIGLPHPHDGRALRRYVEQYHYDAVANFQELVHQADGGTWRRRYNYEEPSLLEPGVTSNRLSRTVVHPDGNQPVVEPYSHDAHGNMTSMPHLPVLRWDYRDQLQASERQVVTNGGTPDTTFYVCDAAGQRARKITERQAGPGAPPRRVSERIYVGGIEIYREYDPAGQEVALERETLHVTDGSQGIALVETLTVAGGAAVASPVPRHRYQLGNHLGSALLEVDGEGGIISYEEYYPYGATAYQAAGGGSALSAKRYRYTGKERDEETGLYYHRARYYAPWLGRWTSADPIGIADGLNQYLFVRANPLTFVDPDGTAGEVFGRGQIITASEYQSVVSGENTLAAGMVAMKLYGGRGEHLVMPLAALEYAGPAVPGQDATHRAYRFTDAIWASKYGYATNEVHANLLTSLGAQRILASKKMIAAVAIVGVSGGLSYGVGLTFAASRLATTLLATSGEGLINGALTSAGLTALEGGSVKDIVASAKSGGAWGFGLGLGFGLAGGVLTRVRAPQPRFLSDVAPATSAPAAQAVQAAPAAPAPSASPGQGVRQFASYSDATPIPPTHPAYTPRQSASAVMGASASSVTGIPGSQWLHLLARRLGGPEWARNFVAGTFEANYQMGRVEALVVRLTRAGQSVEYTGKLVGHRLNLRLVSNDRTLLDVWLDVRVQARAPRGSANIFNQSFR